jgi:hypothetical protein
MKWANVFCMKTGQKFPFADGVARFNADDAKLDAITVFSNQDLIERGRVTEVRR